MVSHWTGRTACALQSALRMSNEAFAQYLDVGLRTVAGWHEKPELRPQSEKQQLLDVALARASAEAKERFAALTGLTPDDDAGADQADATTAAEHRLINDENISGALARLDELAGWEPGTARRPVAARLIGLDPRQVLDRSSRRRRIGPGVGRAWRTWLRTHGKCWHQR